MASINFGQLLPAAARMAAGVFVQWTAKVEHYSSTAAVMRCAVEPREAQLEDEGRLANRASVRETLMATSVANRTDAVRAFIAVIWNPSIHPLALNGLLWAHKNKENEWNPLGGWSREVFSLNFLLFPPRFSMQCTFVEDLFWYLHTREFLVHGAPVSVPLRHMSPVDSIVDILVIHCGINRGSWFIVNHLSIAFNSGHHCWWILKITSCFAESQL